MEQEKTTDRQEAIHSKGFNISDNYRDYKAIGTEGMEYKKIKVGVKSLEDAILDLNALKPSMPKHQYTNKAYIM